MVRYIRDVTGRFPERPYYKEDELDRECEQIICRFLKQLHGKIVFPATTDDLTKLIETEAGDLDLFADLLPLGRDVEGVTEFTRNRKPRVKIAKALSENETRENRLRTTLTHEYGHVHFHRYLFELEPAVGELVGSHSTSTIQCKRESMIDAPKADWLEWQAGHVCGAILMPVTFLRKRVAAYQEKARLFGPIALRTEHALSLIEDVVAHFQVSADAARVRLLRLGHLTQVAPGPSLFG